jgi:hypothetical protein
MDQFTTIQMDVARDRIARYRREADVARIRARQGRRQPIRRTIGRTMIRIGQRMAAEPSFRPARSR